MSGETTATTFALEPTHHPRCYCGRRVGMQARLVVVTGVVSEHPAEPDGLQYVPCPRCHQFVRLEIAPPDAGKLHSGAIAA
jgi:hypothetical protein